MKEAHKIDMQWPLKIVGMQLDTYNGGVQYLIGTSFIRQGGII